MKDRPRGKREVVPCVCCFLTLLYYSLISAADALACAARSARRDNDRGGDPIIVRSRALAFLRQCAMKTTWTPPAISGCHYAPCPASKVFSRAHARVIMTTFQRNERFLAYDSNNSPVAIIRHYSTWANVSRRRAIGRGVINVHLCLMPAQWATTSQSSGKQ